MCISRKLDCKPRWDLCVLPVLSTVPRKLPLESPAVFQVSEGLYSGDTWWCIKAIDILPDSSVITPMIQRRVALDPELME